MQSGMQGIFFYLVWVRLVWATGNEVRDPKNICYIAKPELLRSVFEEGFYTSNTAKYIYSVLQ